MNWANSFFQKVPETLSTDGRTDGQTSGVNPVYPHSTFGGAGYNKHNSRIPGNAYIRQCTGSILTQVMAWCLCSAKSLHDLMLNYNKLLEQISVELLNLSFKKMRLNVSSAKWQVTHICVGKLTILGSDNGLSPGRRQAIIGTNIRILLIWPLRTNFSDILIGIQTLSFRKIHLKMSSVKWRPFRLCLNALKSQVCCWRGCSLRPLLREIIWVTSWP